MKNILIVTYCTWKSYGSILQAVGLRNELLKLGYDNRIVTIGNELNREYRINNSYRFPIIRLLKNIQDILLFKKIKNKHDTNNEFIKSHLKFMYFDSYEDLAAYQFDNTIFMAGSDQIWHPALCNPVFFLDFVKEGRKLSYAASMGVTDVPDKNTEVFRKYINNFDGVLSTREDECRETLARFTDKPIKVHIDPVFFFHKDWWRKFEKHYGIKKRYILVYAIYWDTAFNRRLKIIHDKYGIDILSLENSLRNIYANHKIFDAGIENFLWLVDHAYAIITSSFHGAAFSIIFEKKFSVIINPDSKSRITNLLRHLECNPLSIDNLVEENMDYSIVNKNISYEIKKSKSFLEGQLSEN